MKNRLIIGCAAAATLLAAGSAQTAGAQAHRHIGHVADEFADTPDNAGLLAVAQAEAEIAAQHARLAAGAGDLGGIQRHAMHVSHALDPETAERGPGKGYGVVRAAEGAARHITMAGGADDASDAVKAHSEHVATAAGNVVGWAREALEIAAGIGNAGDVAGATEMAERMSELLQRILSGTDADGNGRVSWGEGEGGLEQAATHLRLMKEAEGLG